jgi:NAD(P)-dependent dehydrogenase (short-subunit alcohol dehydrogenase family)
MTILITGGNKGLGEYICQTLGATSLSRENGMDITDEKCILQIAQESLKYRVFINNAFDGPPQESWANFAQVNLYLAIYDTWKAADKDGYIFNIGSIGSQNIVSPEPRFETYRISKAALDHASRQGSMAFKQNQVKFKTTLIIPDRLDTPLVRSRPNWTGNGINCGDIAETIKFVLTCQSNTCIEQIVLSLNYHFKDN